MSNYDKERFTFRGFRGGDLKGFGRETEDNWKQEEFTGFKSDSTYSPEESFPQDFPAEKKEQERPVRKRKKRRKKHYLLKFLLLIVLLVGARYLLHSELFDINGITVVGNSHFKTETIINMAGINKGANSFETDMSQARERLEADPYIKSAEIRRNLPKGVTITVIERKESAIIKYNKEYAVIDNSGTVLRITEKRQKLTWLLNLTVRKATPGRLVEVEETEILSKGLELLQAMEKGNLYFKKIKISGVMTRAYISDKLLCRGKVRNMIASMESGNLQRVVYDLKKKKKKRGIINIGDDQYCSYQPELN